MSDDYIIPANVTSGFEFVEGVGLREAIILFAVAAIGGGSMFAFRAIFSIPLHYAAFWFVLLPMLFAFFIVKKNPYGPSPLSMLQAIVRYYKSQRLYLFKFNKESP